MKQIYIEILKIGIPTLTFQLLTSLSITLINRAANGYGDAVIADILSAIITIFMAMQIHKEVSS